MRFGAKPRPYEALAQPIPAALGTGPPETCWLEDLRPLAAVTDGLAHAAALGLAGRVRAGKREPLLRRRVARRRAPASTVGLQTHVREDLLDHRLPGRRGPGLVQAQTVLRTVCAWTTCMIAAMILGSPPQFGQCAVSISKTRLSRLGGPGAYATGRIGATGSRQRMSLMGRVRLPNLLRWADGMTDTGPWRHHRPQFGA